MAKPLSLLDQSSDSEVEFTINKNYAENYDKWRNKEEMQKLKDLSKDISDTSSSESEEEDEPVIEKDFLKALSLIKSKDPMIYNENVELFKEESSPKKPKIKKEKPMFMKDYERKLVLERNGKLSDEDESDVPPPKRSANEELDEITKSLKAAVDSDDENDETQGSKVGGLFQVRVKTEEERDNEEEEYLQWLKGQKNKVDKNTEKELSFLRRYWNDSNLDEGEKFLRDYLLNQKFIAKDGTDGIPSYEEITREADALQEEEETLQQQEQFEHKYNFRFEEPDPEFIKRYPRTVGDSLRRVDNKRKMKREEYTERKKKEKDQKREELKRLKALKRKEIEEKFFKLKEASGKDEINFDEDDIESDFDPDKHDEKMKELFDDDYYAVEEEQKPEFLHDDEIDDEDWDHWTREQARLKAAQSTAEPEDEEDSSAEEEQAPDRKAEFEQEMIESTRTGKRKGRKKSLFAKIISKPKPLYDPDGKSFEEYLDEYYSLDYEDVIGELPVRFKYRKVIPNDFGLTPDEIFAANDKELNRWCSVKKTCQYRRDEEELYDVQAFKKKAQNTVVKEKILASVYAPPQEEEDALNANDSKEGVGNAKRRRRNRKKKKSENSGINDEQHNASQEECVTPAAEENSDNLGTSKYSRKSKKKKRHNTESENGTTHDEQDYTAQEEVVSPPFENSDNLGTSKKSKKKKRKNAESENCSTNDEQGYASQEWDVTLVAENSDDLGTPKNSQKSKKKKRRHTESNSEANNESEYNDGDGSKTDHQLTAIHKDDAESLEFKNLSDGGSPKKKKKKHKNEPESPSKTLPNSSELPETIELKSNTDKSRERYSLNIQGSSVGRPEQNNSPSKKSKKKRNRNRSAGKGAPFHAPSHGDKRLAVSDSRLAAFGINPKKFKSSIIYSAKK